MTTDENGNGQERGGGWQPTPQGEYDSDATAFVQLPPDMSTTGAPLEAPGHGYVPPEAWAAHDPNATAQWTFQAAAPAPSELTGQWTIPVAQGDLPDESGEFTTSSLASQWTSGNPPATLPGGAPAPWATPQPQPAAPEPDEAPEPEAPAHDPAFQGPAPEGPQDAPAPDAPAPDAPVPDAPAPDAAAQPTHVTDSDEHPHISYVLRVNGTDRPVTDAWIGESLLYVLRERLGLAGAKDGCSQGECGACNVQVDGRLVASCLVPAATAAGSEVRTVEGLATDGEPSDVQRALAACGAVQCGFCIPGMAMTVHDLLEGNHAPSELETRQALCGNLCRCTGYRGVLDAVREVVAERAASAAAAAEAAEAAGAAGRADGTDGTGQARIPHQIPHPHDGGMA
ncbi:(2Fe-2S)-binding protein [Streptomyces ficellus]|uniref:(2Fe-2S)-binding protein n=1 Tax=Streptomyces ficellus TaxID=1977088 RepID=A0A6I6FLZ6_9ACTN|nr:(2Fe-2S)-binding protein [Streptomyces ficellus]QGV80375.1 (2Fe-2S)-binding protein [Streptomyces ficellus]